MQFAHAREAYVRPHYFATVTFATVTDDPRIDGHGF
jgi:hypothetical protein